MGEGLGIEKGLISIRYTIAEAGSPAVPHAGLIRTFGVFAIGYVIRPVGGIIFGQIEDRHGRRKALILSVAMMAIPATLVGRLPTYAQVGILAPVPLLVLRILQGLSIVPPLQ